MNTDILQKAWDNAAASSFTQEKFKRMLSERSHPVLKVIQRQVIIETVLFTLFIAVYYDWFDGSQKPVFANLMLIVGILLAILHNLVWYFTSRNRVFEGTLSFSLSKYLNKIRTYSIASISLRIITSLCILLYFISIKPLSEWNPWIIACLTILIGIQVFVQARIWSFRISTLQRLIDQFPKEN